MGKILLTRTGYQKLLKELEMLSRVERPRVVNEILEDAPDWGIPSDPDFQRILDRRRWVDRRIQQLQEILANAEVLVGSNLPPDQVRFNARVKLLNLITGKECQFKMVGPLEADASNGCLSTASPLGRALMGRSQGERVELETPAGRRSYLILEIEMDEV
jgi:transcription elongation factor GreA|uniref:Transcription elongation factor GreA n=1 Tax=Desulfobacca acetoxidans TaxID=60893 RepID=A0A7C3SI40_9BACT